MENSNTPTDNEKSPGFAGFAFKRIILGIVLVVVGLWIIVQVVGMFDKFFSPKETEHAKTEVQLEPPPLPSTNTDVLDFHDQPFPSSQNMSSQTDHDTETLPAKSHDMMVPAEDHGSTASLKELPYQQKLEQPTATQKPAVKTESARGIQGTQATTDSEDATGHRPFQTNAVKKAKGVAFVEALIEPLNYELNERFYGWRPNDVINFTDNVNNMQLGILEFTRRTTIVLVERISRTGVTAAFDPNLQQAMNWFMIKAEQYWLPSPEDKYKEGLKDLREYKNKLENGQANFYTRNDNIIPLLSVYEDLLGGCEENLVKQSDENGEPISYFMADDYFYYAKGVAMAMLPVLEAISTDFAATIESRRGTDVLHNAIEALHHATKINPIIITNSNLDGILANHRANLAAPISHARFYIGVLIKTLST